MNPLYKLQHAGQSIWLDNITRGMLDGTLKHYIDHLAVTGLTSNPTIFNKAIEGSELYDDAIHQKTREGKSGEALFFDLALDDLRRAANHGFVQETVPPDRRDYRATLAAFSHAGINETELSERLQIEGTASFSKSWNELLACIERKSAILKEMRWSQGGRQ